MSNDKAHRTQRAWRGWGRFVLTVCIAIPLGIPLGNCIPLCNQARDTDVPIWEHAIESHRSYYYGQSVAEAADGGLIAAGESFIGDPDSALVLVRRASDGDPVWLREYSIAADSLQATKVLATADGGAIVLGQTGEMYDETSPKDYYLLQVDDRGEALWSKRFGGAGDDFAADMVTLEDGYAVLGTTDSAGSGGTDFELIRLDAAGNALWSRTYGGSANDVAVKVAATPDGGFALFGDTESYSRDNPALYLVKVDGDGEEAWYQTYNFFNYRRAVSMAVAPDGGFMLTDTSGPPHVIRTDGDGNMLWDRTYTSLGYGYGYDIASTADGFALTGQSESTYSNGATYCGVAFVLHIEGEGAVAGVRHYGEIAKSDGVAIIPTSDGNLAIAGNASGYDDNGQHYRHALYMAKIPAGETGVNAE